MKALLFLFLAVSAMAEPTIEEARSLLGSPRAKDRAAHTLKIWQSGKTSLPLLRNLSKDPDPEVANRASFVLSRLSMGLMPDSPPDLLKLAQALEQAEPDARTAHLIKLLEYAEGAPIALALLDQWARTEIDQAQRLLKNASLVTEALLEQRRHWQNFFTSPLSAQCRAAMLVEIAKQDLPMQSQLIAILAANDTLLVYLSLQKFELGYQPALILNLARSAILGRDIPLALRILRDHLPLAPDSDLARALAYLEISTNSPPARYNGPWKQETDLFRARLQNNHEAALRLSQNLPDQALLRYESQLLSGQLALPSRPENEDPLLSETALKTLHSSFAQPPSEPDIEALSASVLLDWTVLARTLTLLGSPTQAAETLTSNGQATSAVNLLWRTKHREEALTLAKETLNNFDTREEAKMRITLTSLYLESGDKEAARKVFEPLLYLNEMRKDYQAKAISLGLQIFPRENLYTLTPDLRSQEASQRAAAIPHFLPYPDKVAVTWYEHFLKKDALQTPSTLFKKVETLLEGDRQEAVDVITAKRLTTSKKLLLPSDSLYQNILFLRLPETLPMVTQAAWYQLSTKDLLNIIRDETWPKKKRIEALKIALQINPADIDLLWHNLQLNQLGDLETLHHLPLGKPSLTLQLAALTGKRESLQLASEIADLRDSNSLRCLSILAKSYLKIDKPAEAARLLQVALCGETAAGNHPATPIKATLENLAAYFEARATLTEDESQKEIWHSRLKKIR